MIPLPYKLIAISAALAFVFIFGYMKGSAQAEAELAKFSAEQSKQTLKLERKNTDISAKVVIKYVDKTNIIREKEYVYRDLAKNTVPNQHDMSSGWVHLHDSSASASIPDAARASDASPTGITDNTALITVVTNYSICQQNAEQLIGLQRWIDENKTAVDLINAKSAK